jgi:hypothetical protein
MELTKEELSIIIMILGKVTMTIDSPDSMLFQKIIEIRNKLIESMQKIKESDVSPG